MEKIVYFAMLALLASCVNKKETNEQRPVLTVAGVIHLCPINKIALIERGKTPKGLAMFGGHVEYEDPVTAFKREAQEELNIEDLSNIKLIGIHGIPGRDPRQHSVEITYSAVTRQIPKAGSDAKTIVVFTNEELKKALVKEQFAFDHAEILNNYLKTLQHNVCMQN